MFPLPARTLIRHGHWSGPAAATVTLDYDERLLRRKRLETSAARLMVDLAETVSLEPGDALKTDDGRLIEIAAAEEPVVQIRGDLPRLAWHIGNRHTPCQIGPTT